MKLVLLLAVLFIKMIRSLHFTSFSVENIVKKSILTRSIGHQPLSFDVHKNQESVWNSVVFLHGILGNKRNWRTFGQEFVKFHNNDYQAVAIDHRGHGNSPRLPTANTVSACADDLIELFESGSISCVEPPRIICAHSFGGKVALKYLQTCVQHHYSLPQYTWILDSLPGPYDTSLDATQKQSVFGIINLVASLPTVFSSKEWVINELIRNNIPRDIALWLGMNVIRAEGEDNQFKFSFDIQTIIELFEDYCKEDMWQFLQDYDGDSKIQFIRAGKNNAWTQDVLARFEELNRNNPNIVLHTMPHVGHWLHSEDLKGTLKIITDNSK